MDNKKEYLDSFNKNYRELLPSFTNVYLAHLQGKDNFKSKLFKVFTKGYYSRKKLISNGAIIYGYTFRINNFDVEKSSHLGTWVMFSPEIYFREQPEEYEKLYFKIMKELESSNSYKDKRLIKVVKATYNEPSYIKIPSSYCDNHIVYISYVDQYISLNKYINNGINLIYINPSITREILYVSEEIIAKVDSIINK